MGSLCFTWAGWITHCHTAAWQDQTQSRTVPPFVSQERKPACTEAEELGSSLLTMPAIQSTAHSATMRPSLYSTLSWALGIILAIQAVKPARKGSSEILMSLNGKNQKQNFTARLVGVRGLGLSWTKLWRIQVLLHIGGGQMTNTSRGTSPANGSVSLWVRMWAAQERKIKTVVAQELHWGQVKGRKQPEFRAAGSHSAAADISDKHGGQKGKKRKGKNTIPKPQTDKPSEPQHGQLQREKHSVKATPHPKLSYHSYFKYPLSLVMLKVSKKSPSISSADVNGCTGTAAGSTWPSTQQVHGCAPFSASTNNLGMTWELSGWFSISQGTNWKNLMKK